MISFEEFEKTCYYTQYNIIIPLLNRMKISKLDCFTRDKYDKNKLQSKLIELYNLNLDKLKTNQK